MMAEVADSEAALRRVRRLFINRDNRDNLG